MNPIFENPFASIEDTREFLTLLTQTIFETKLEIQADVQRESNGNSPPPQRRTELDFIHAHPA